MTKEYNKGYEDAFLEISEFIASKLKEQKGHTAKEIVEMFNEILGFVIMKNLECSKPDVPEVSDELADAVEHLFCVLDQTLKGGR